MAQLSIVVAVIALRGASGDDLWCLSNAPANACGHCVTEKDCGNSNKDFFFCSNMRDPSCPAPAPTPPGPAPPSPPSPPGPPAPSTCDQGCTQNAQTFPCRGRIQYLEQQGTKLDDAIKQVNEECQGQCSCSASDFGPTPSPSPPAPPTPPSPPSPGPADGWCKKDSTKNACGACSDESSCGNDDDKQFFCLKDKEPACSAPGPSPGPSPPGPATAWCKHDSPQNACKPCDGMESACGNDDPNKYFCLSAKEPACGAPGPAPGPGPAPATAWCAHNSPQNACQPCDGMESACGNSDPSKFFCLATKEPACGSPPTPGGGGYCAADSAQNACGRCPTMSESECGNTQPGVYKCWGLPDARCHANTTSTFLI